MPRNAQAVRRSIAMNAMLHAARVLDDLRAIRALRAHKIALGVDGDFIDADFDGQTDLQHLTPGVANGLLDEAHELLSELEADNGMNYFLESRKG